MVLDNELQFIWKIENYSYSWQGFNEFLVSPTFQMCSKEGISWCLKLYPRGILPVHNFTSIYLERQFTGGPAFVTADYEVSFIRSDGKPECIAGEKGCVFLPGHIYGFTKLLSRQELFQKKSDLLPNDTLTVQCRITFEKNRISKQIQTIAKSAIWFHKDCFLWDAGEFNYVSPYKPGYFAKFVTSNAELLLILNENSIHVCFRATDVFAQMLRFRLGIFDSNKSTSEFLVDEYMYTRDTKLSTVFFISRSRLLQRKDLYLPQGRLVLHCESSYSTGIHMSQIESYTYDKILSFNKFDKKKKIKDSQSYVTDPECCAHICSSVKNDFQNLYQEGALNDFTIRVEGVNLQTHKAVLCARSPVFKAMLTSNMQESSKNFVDIIDLGVDIVHRMLAFMYSDKVDNLDWKTAKKLYFAADKYDIPLLKRMCSEFLKINLKADNVSEVLLLANMHSDEDLKKVASEFMQCTKKEKIPRWYAL